MEVVGLSSVENNMWVFSVLESMVVETVLAAGKSLACLIMVTGSLLNDISVSPKLTAMDGRFPFEELHKRQRPDQENKDGSETEDDDDDDDDDDDANDQDEDAGDEDFSGEEGEDEGDPEDDPEANGDGGSDDEDDDDDDGDDEDDDEEGRTKTRTKRMMRTRRFPSHLQKRESENYISTYCFPIGVRSLE